MKKYFSDWVSDGKYGGSGKWVLNKKKIYATILGIILGCLLSYFMIFR